MYHQLIYSSRCSVTSGMTSILREIVAASERKNSSDRITGFLLFDKIQFMQILEGDRDDVDRSFERISQDARHDRVILLHRRDVPTRAFPEWGMGGVVRAPEIDHIFRRYDWPNLLERSSSADRLIGMARELSTWEQERSTQRGLSSR